MDIAPPTADNKGSKTHHTIKLHAGQLAWKTSPLVLVISLGHGVSATLDASMGAMGATAAGNAAL